MGERREAFIATFGEAPELEADAPGRVNLLGEHTDYNEGFVLPTAIPQRTHVTLARREGPLVRVHSENLQPGGTFTLGEERKTQSWFDFAQGVTRILRLEGHVLSGFDAYIDSTVPIGGGLSSSAALSVSLLRALRRAFSLSLDDRTLARIAHRAETEFVGAPVGVMDPMACSLADERHALFLDTRTLEFDRVLLPEPAELLVIDSGVSHQHTTGGYRARRAECEEAARLLGVRMLRDVEPTRSLDDLPTTLQARVRHVLTENERVLEGVAAMRRGDVLRLGQLFWESHASMRDDYAVSTPEIDRLVELARAEAGVFGARLTGGGFGGSVLALVRVGQGRAIGERVVGRYRESTGHAGRLLVPSA